jgi:hypothetical protein
MRFAIDAHAIGRHLTGNEVYVRSLLRSFAALDHESDFVTYFSADDARQWTADRFQARQVSPNPFVRLGVELAMKLRQDRPDLVHVQYTAPLGCPVPVVVSVHDVSFLVHPEYFPKLRALQLRWTVARTIKSATRILTGSDFSRDSIIEAYGSQRPAPHLARERHGCHPHQFYHREAIHSFRGRPAAAQEPHRPDRGIRPISPRVSSVGASFDICRQRHLVQPQGSRGCPPIGCGGPDPVRRLRHRRGSVAPL